MAAAQGKYSWHVRLTKLTTEDNCVKIFFDKKDSSIIDYVTVHETAAESPPPEDEVKINRPEALGMEASKLNLDISQQFLVTHEGGKAVPPAMTYEKPCFWDDDCAGVVADKAYRYRRIKLPGREKHPDENCRKPITIVTRADVDAKLPGSEPGAGFVAIRTLNEYRSKTSKPWRSQLETAKGAVLATEIRNNAGNFARWVAQCIISGCDTLKLVWVTRQQPLDNTKHQILKVETSKVAELGTQIGLTPDSGWGSVRSILDMVMTKADGDFILIKDPLKPILRLYRLPENQEDEMSEVPNLSEVIA
eukprot:GHVN01037271.1.p1 GENE.GHVN01037271.1~~GHVN01037271.1.p1  ORF type:complete len:306 (-),score=50.63 GHVN01037271.1:345-1262(-)